MRFVRATPDNIKVGSGLCYEDGKVCFLITEINMIKGTFTYYPIHRADNPVFFESEFKYLNGWYISRKEPKGHPLTKIFK
jgi:hypothetical protein